MNLTKLFKVLFTITFFIGFSTIVSAKVDETIINLRVTEKGFEPSQIDVSIDKPIKLNITRKTDNTCSTSIQIPSLKLKEDLPLNKTVGINLGKLSKGEIRFGCGMNMMDSGIIYVK